MARSEGGTEDAADARDDDLVGRAIGKYTLARVIGRGGMGIVYEALNTAIGKRVAIKLVSGELSKNKDSVKRFQREAQAASAVESAHIVDIFDAGVSDEGVPYIVMELLRGEDLGHRIKRLGRLDLDEAVHVGVQILRGLARAHAAGIVHRDLKPDNVFLVDRDDDSAFVKILDFGISKVARQGETPVQTLTKQGTVLGTPFYMAPEQAQGLPDTDGRADLWSVGAILYECLTGRAPHTGASYEQVIVNICAKDAADVRTHNPGVPEPVAKVISKALARDRDERFSTARELMEALIVATGGVVPSGPRSSDEPSDPFPSGRAAVLPSSGSRARASGGGVRVGSGDMARAASVDGARAVSGDHSHPSASGYDDTLEMKSGGPSRVGWSTSGRAAVRRDRRRVIAVALGALGLGVIATIALAVRKPGDAQVSGGPGDTGAISAHTSDGRSREVSVQLRSNARGARFMVDGKPLAGGLLRGLKGETKKVLVEAEGYTSLEAIVPLEPEMEAPELTLSPRTAPSGSDSAGAGSSAPPARSSAEIETPRSAKSASPKATASPTAKASAQPIASATATATPVQTAAPATTPTLTIKRD